MSTEQERDGAESVLEVTIPDELVDILNRHIVPSYGHNNTYPLRTDELGYIEITREGDRVLFTLDVAYEPKLRELFGFSTAQLEGRDYVTGFIFDRQLDENQVVLRIDRHVLVGEFLDLF